jgi:protein subunit release factor B
VPRKPPAKSLGKSLVDSPGTDAIAERLRSLGIREADLDESFVRSGGKGGQNVNKVATCVVLVHRPTGIAIKCQLERTQALNREHARRLLADKLEARALAEKRAAQAAAAKLRRQKRRRSRQAKEKMLHDKRARSETKARRRRVSPAHGDE